MPRLTPEIVAAMRIERRRGMGYRAMARLANVSATCVQHAVMGVSWKHGVSALPVSEEEDAQIKRRYGVGRPTTRLLTDRQVRSIRRRHAEGESSQAELAVEFGIAQSCISLIIQRKTYREVLD